MSAPGRVVILNGAPRSGKSSIARAMQDSLPGIWLNLGVDVFMAATPKSLHPGIGLRPGGERPDLEQYLPLLYAALYASIAAHAERGFNVVTDLGHHDWYSQPLNILPSCARQLVGFDVLFVGVDCPIETIMARRNADPQSGYYAAGDGVPAPVQRWQDAVHQSGIYDLRIDSSQMLPDEAAALIGARLGQQGSGPSAFERLARL